MRGISETQRKGANVRTIDETMSGGVSVLFDVVTISIDN